MTSKIGRAIIVAVHFRAARLYSGLEVSVLAFGVGPGGEATIGSEAGVGWGPGVGGAGASTLGAGVESVVRGVEAKRAEAAGFGFAAAMTGSGASALGASALSALPLGASALGLGAVVLVAVSGISAAAIVVSFTTAAFFADAHGFSSAVGGFGLTALVFAASVFFAVLATFSAAGAAVAVALAEVFRVLAGALAFGALTIGTAVASFIAWAFLGLVVDTCRMPRQSGTVVRGAMGATMGIAFSQVVPHLDSSCVLRPSNDILLILRSIPLVVSVSKLAQCCSDLGLSGRDVECTVGKDDGGGIDEETVAQNNRVIFGVALTPRRESLAYEHHMQMAMGKWLVAMSLGTASRQREIGKFMR